MFLQFLITCKRTNNATHYVKLGKKRRESSKRNYYIISARVIIRAIIIITNHCQVFCPCSCSIALLLSLVSCSRTLLLSCCLALFLSSSLALLACLCSSQRKSGLRTLQRMVASVLKPLCRCARSCEF